jgi:hypothetical protein
MPIDPFFTAAPQRRVYTEADKAERDRLRALPFEERRAEYQRLKGIMRTHVQIDRGAFLFVRDMDQRLNWRKRRDWHENYRKYCTAGNVVPGGAYSCPEAHRSISHRAPGA